MITVAETGEYQKQAKRLLSPEETSALISYLAEHPKAGDLIEGTGGVRKLRWAVEGRGKRGGARVIYFYYNEKMPLYLLTLFGKKDKSNLTQGEKNELKELVNLLVKANGL